MDGHRLFLEGQPNKNAGFCRRFFYYEQSCRFT
jgi:hypothetical protein